MTAGLRLFSFERAEPAVVEVLGRPGSGKSFLCDSLLETPGWEIEPGADEPGRRWLAPLTFIIRPIVATLAIAAASSRPPVDIRRYREVVRVVRKYDGIRRIKRRGITVVDEGPAHQLLNVFFWSSATPLSRFFTRQLLRAIVRETAAFVYLDIGKKAALENTIRRDHRSSWFNRKMSDKVVRQFLADTSYDEIVDTLRSIAPEKVRCFSTLAEARQFLVVQANDLKPRTGTAFLASKDKAADSERAIVTDPTPA